LLENDPSAADGWLDEEDDRKFQKESKEENEICCRSRE
jgi:hypothetical protein